MCSWSIKRVNEVEKPPTISPFFLLLDVRWKISQKLLYSLQLIQFRKK